MTVSPSPALYPILPGGTLAPGGAAEVGNKAWNLMRMAEAKMPVPAAFVLPTQWCGRAGIEAALKAALADGVRLLEISTDLVFGGTRRPLLLSVRSGAALSMPGMMETVLDVGLNTQTVEALIRLTGDPRLGWDSYRRLVQGYAEVVAGLPTEPFEALLATRLAAADADSERDLDYRDLRALTRSMLACYQDLAGSPFPTDPMAQLAAATQAVFGSWNAAKAVSYRRMNKFDDAAGTAVTVQTMVFGNAGGGSGAGVGFTRDPATGAPGLYFDFEFNGQGEDVVSGREKLVDHDRLRRVLPSVWTQLEGICQQLEALFGDAQDFEFTVQARALFLLQTRRAKRTDWAALAIAVDMVAEGLLTQSAALVQISCIDLNGVARTSFTPPVPPILAMAQSASLGVACGAIALDCAAVERQAVAGEQSILVRQDTVTSDIEGMSRAAGILTGSGGRTSHAAVVARQLGKVCLVACLGLEIDSTLRQCRIGGVLLNEGDMLALDGNTGAVHAGKLDVTTERPEAALRTIAGWQRTTVVASA